MKHLTTPLLLIVAIVLGFLLLRTCGDAEPAIPPEIQAELDAYRAAKPKSDSVILQNVKLVDSVGVLASRLRASTRPARVTATGSGITADSAAILAQRATSAADSALAWETAYKARSAQAEALESVVARLDSAAIQDSIGKVALQRALTETSTRLLTAEGLVADLVEAAEKKHRWAWLQRMGVSVGPTVVASVDGRFSYGIGVTAGVKIYP